MFALLTLATARLQDEAFLTAETEKANFGAVLGSDDSSDASWVEPVVDVVIDIASAIFSDEEELSVPLEEQCQPWGYVCGESNPISGGGTGVDVPCCNGLFCGALPPVPGGYLLWTCGDDLAQELEEESPMLESSDDSWVEPVVDVVIDIASAIFSDEAEELEEESPVLESSDDYSWVGPVISIIGDLFSAEELEAPEKLEESPMLESSDDYSWVGPVISIIGDIISADELEEESPMLESSDNYSWVGPVISIIGDIISADELEEESPMLESSDDYSWVGPVISIIGDLFSDELEEESPMLEASDDSYAPDWTPTTGFFPNIAEISSNEQDAVLGGLSCEIKCKIEYAACRVDHPHDGSTVCKPTKSTCLQGCNSANSLTAATGQCMNTVDEPLLPNIPNEVAKCTEESGAISKACLEKDGFTSGCADCFLKTRTCFLENCSSSDPNPCVTCAKVWVACSGYIPPHSFLSAQAATGNAKAESRIASRLLKYVQ